MGGGEAGAGAGQGRCYALYIQGGEVGGHAGKGMDAWAIAMSWGCMDPLGLWLLQLLCLPLTAAGTATAATATAAAAAATAAAAAAAAAAAIACSTQPTTGKQAGAAAAGCRGDSLPVHGCCAAPTCTLQQHTAGSISMLFLLLHTTQCWTVANLC